MLNIHKLMKSEMNVILTIDIINDILLMANREDLPQVRLLVINKLRELKNTYPISFRIAYPEWLASIPKTRKVSYLIEDFVIFLNEVEDELFQNPLD